MTNTIKVTEGQKKEIKYAFDNLHYPHNKIYHLTSETDIDIVTAARIVAGEKYETIREFQIGDIAFNECGTLVEIVSDFTTVGAHTNSVGYANRRIDEFKLVCKAENTEKGGK